MTDNSKGTITPERWHRAGEIFADALEHGEGNAREAFLLQACGDDQALSKQVRALIDAEGRASNVLGMTQFAQVLASAVIAGADEAGDSADHWIGQRLGAYKVVSEIARGGMGLVFKGHRDDAEFNKDVAIKLVRGNGQAGGGARLIERFKAERQILATLDHPNIARLIDGGTTAGGWPFLVMEFVDGEPITAYAARHALGVNSRLDLFRSVCAAVHFAHQRLVVHRDLKPSNIFVNQQGDVKLLDFGIAKMLEASAANGMRDAATTMLAMTPAYASPEQIRNEPITTASDVYALGVVLYELLTGHSPYKANKTQPLDLAKEICETDPERPSTVVGRTDVNASGPQALGIVALDLKRLRRGLRGDLDNIVLMALKKDPARRYASAEQLSEDVRRYLDHRSVLARADTFSYRAAKFIARNRFAVGFATLAAVGLITGTVVALHQASVAIAERARAEKHFANVRKLANTALFDVHRAIEGLPGAVRVRKPLLEAATKYLDGLAMDAGADPADPVLQSELGAGYVALAEIQGTAVTNASLGDRAAGRKSLERGVAILADAYERQPEDAKIAHKYAYALRSLAKFEWSSMQFDAASNAAVRAVAVGEATLQRGVATPDNTVELAQALADRAREVPAAKRTPRPDRLSAALRAQSLLEGLLKTPLSKAENAAVTAALPVVYAALADVTADPARPETQSQAFEYAMRGLLITEARDRDEPGNRITQYNLASLYARLSSKAILLKRETEAVALQKKAVDVLAKLLDSDPDDKNTRMYFVRALAVLAELHADANRMELADAALQRALAGQQTVDAESAKLLYHRHAAFLLPSVGTVIEAYRAKQTGVTSSQRNAHCQRASDFFRQVRVAQVALKDVFLDQPTDPAAGVKTRLMACSRYVAIPD